MLRPNSIKNNFVLTMSLFVMLTVLTLGFIHYYSVRQSLMEKVYDSQLVSSLKAHQSNLLIIIEKALETSLNLADDPAFLEWFSSNDGDPQIKKIALQKLNVLHHDLGYHTIFAVNKNTNEYWKEDFELLEVISEDDPDDSWFFETINSKRKSTLNFDYNKVLDQSMLFVNVLMGKTDDPVGIAGVGIDPAILIDQFKQNKPSGDTHLWLVDNQGKILLSENTSEININIRTLFTNHDISELLTGPDEQIIREINFKDNKYELASMTVGSSDYRVVMVVPQKYILKTVNVIVYNTIWLTIIVLILVLLVSSLLAKSISKPIIHLTQLSNQMAHSKLNVKVKEKLFSRRDEIGQLAVEFDQMQKQLSDMIERLNLANTDLENEKGQLKKINVELKTAIEKASESEKLTKAFMANISHEIRTPMNSIIGFAQLLEMELVDDALLKSYAEMIIKNSNQLLSILNNIIEVAKLDSGITKPKYSDFSANQLIDEGINLFAYDIKSSVKIVNESGTKQIDVTVKSDKVLTLRVISNLISNAIKYTKEGIVVVGFTTNDEEIIFKVSDTGVGIAEEHQQSIFKPFWQVNNSSSINEGAGLGLAISKMVVDILKGKIWLKSTPDKGSEFYFSLPLNQN